MDKQTKSTGKHNRELLTNLEMSRAMRKPDFAYANCESGKRLCFRHTDSSIPLLPKSEISSFGPGRKPRRPGFSRRGSNKRIVGLDKCIYYNCGLDNTFRVLNNQVVTQQISILIKPSHLYKKSFNVTLDK